MTGGSSKGICPVHNVEKSLQICPRLESIPGRANCSSKILFCFKQNKAIQNSCLQLEQETRRHWWETGVEDWPKGDSFPLFPLLLCVPLITKRIGSQMITTVQTSLLSSTLGSNVAGKKDDSLLLWGWLVGRRKKKALNHCFRDRSETWENFLKVTFKSDLRPPFSFGNFYKV